jgi:D-alanyl-D-alanine carboxypeptidase (penicillin-binding protein 5/6)
MDFDAKTRRREGRLPRRSLRCGIFAPSRLRAITLFAAFLVLSLPAVDAQARAPPPPPEIAGIPVTLLVDLGSGQILHAHQPDRRFPPASMAKVMTLYVAFEEIAAGRLSPERQFAVREATARQWRGRGTSLFLAAGDRISADALLRGIATASANDAAVVLAEGYAGSVPAWTGLMNQAARRLGMTASRFNTPNGWSDNGATYASARDLVKLSQAMIGRYPQLYRRYFGQKRIEWNGRTLVSHDPTIGVVPGADGIKTGHTNEAGYNFLGSAERDSRRLVMVVAGARSEAQRAAASRALLEWGFAAWTVRPLFAAQRPIAEARVQGGDARRLPLVAAAPVYAVLPRGAREPISLRVVYKGPLLAPIRQGAAVAELEVSVGDRPPGRLPLHAARAVGEAGMFDRLVNGLISLIS